MAPATSPALRRRPTAVAAIEEATARLAAAGVETPRADAEWLLAGILGRGRAALALAGELAPATLARFRAAVARRAAREPLQRILGWEEFRGLRLRLTPAVMVPRPETELLVEWALAWLRGRVRARAVDVGTGSGCIACALAAEHPGVEVVACDLSPAALAVAGANVRALGLAGRVRLVAADGLGAVRAASADLVVANPPYLPRALLATLAPEVRDHDPRLALDGGPDGLAVLRPLVREAARVLVPGGRLLLETAGGAQAEVVAATCATAGFTAIELRRDLPGVVRFVGATWPGAAGAARGLGTGRAAAPSPGGEGR